nr:hypothetical protein Iba_scaffold60937CG0010 [Ipomoea batatas]GME13751.1 hypothetical protein Iba_scaffold14647CG0230 [Ipomoea batatas]
MIGPNFRFSAFLHSSPQLLHPHFPIVLRHSPVARAREADTRGLPGRYGVVVEGSRRMRSRGEAESEESGEPEAVHRQREESEETG